MSDRLAILIGNGRFEAERGLAELFGPRHDVASFARLLGDPEVGDFTVFELVDRRSAQLGAELEQLFAAAHSDATVLVYYAGHVVAEPGRGLYLATADTELSAVKDTALPLAAIKGLLRSCGARDVSVVFDCCYVSPTGAIDEADVEHELRRVRTDVTQDVHVIASPTATRAPEDREVTTDTGLEGRMTRCIVEGISTGAADRNGDNRTTARDLNEYLGMRLGDARPLWAGPLDGADPEIVANPHPIEGLGQSGDDDAADVRRTVRRVFASAAVVLGAIAVLWAGSFVAGDDEAPPAIRLLEYFSGPGLPDTVGLVSDLDTLRAVIDRTGWVEHTEPLDGLGPRYPALVTFRLDPRNRRRSGTIELGLRQWAQAEFNGEVYGVGVACADGLNIAEVVIELAGGQAYTVAVQTDRAGDEFFGVVSRTPILRVRIVSTSRFAARQLLVYAAQEHPRAFEDES